MTTPRPTPQTDAVFTSIQGKKEDTSTAGIDYDEDCVVIIKAKWEVARKALATKEGGV